MTTITNQPTTAGRRVDGQLYFFEDGATDVLLGVVLSLAAETYVLRDQVRALEVLLAKHGLVPEQEIATFRPEGELAEEFRVDRDAFFDRLLGPLTRDHV